MAVSDGMRITLGAGDSGTITPLRSVGKPFQLAALARAGLPLEKFSASEVTIMASSHNGEQRHVEVLGGLLERFGFGEDDLTCGTHEPYRSWVERRPLTNNCSGKHVALLVACRMAGWPVDDYWAVGHPAQLRVRRDLTAVFGDGIAPGIDGCGVPTYGVSVGNLAKAYASLAISDDPALAMIRAAYLAAPFYLAGTDRIDTHLTQRYGVLAKSGSAGVWAVGIPSLGLGVATKVFTGDENIAAITVILILEQLGVLSVSDDAEIARLLDWEARTCTGRQAGELRTSIQLQPN